MAHGFDARPITLCHDPSLQVAQGACDSAEARHDAWRAIAADHRFNCSLWREEDKACGRDVPAAGIGAEIGAEVVAEVVAEVITNKRHHRHYQ